mmetsp:Transcript_698/g.1436  ORF Transcript_698/g.1436 Transcript_698/m.1436 type:complete len:210 (+) Transcript_698:1161-1790(+)
MMHSLVRFSLATFFASQNLVVRGTRRFLRLLRPGPTPLLTPAKVIQTLSQHCLLKISIARSMLIVLHGFDRSQQGMRAMPRPRLSASCESEFEVRLLQRLWHVVEGCAATGRRCHPARFALLAFSLPVCKTAAVRCHRGTRAASTGRVDVLAGLPTQQPHELLVPRAGQANESHRIAWPVELPSWRRPRRTALRQRQRRWRWRRLVILN